MAVTTISRYSFTDDTGDGESGNIINGAFFGTTIYDKIDALIAGNITTGGTFRTNYGADTTSYTQANDNLLTGSSGEALGVGSISTLTNLNFYASDSGAIVQRRATIQAVRAGTSNRGGQLAFFTKGDAATGTDVSQAGYVGVGGGGLVWGAPTGGDKGAGAINCQACYDDNVLLTDWVFELAFRGRTEIPYADRLYALDEVEAIARECARLPWMPDALHFEHERHTGGMIRRLWQGQEQQQLYIFDLAKRIAALEAA